MKNLDDTEQTIYDMLMVFAAEVLRADKEGKDVKSKYEIIKTWAELHARTIGTTLKGALQ